MTLPSLPAGLAFPTCPVCLGTGRPSFPTPLATCPACGGGGTIELEGPWADWVRIVRLSVVAISIPEQRWDCVLCGAVILAGSGRAEDLVTVDDAPAVVCRECAARLGIEVIHDVHP
jgi:hypothetical protein